MHIIVPLHKFPSPNKMSDNKLSQKQELYKELLYIFNQVKCLSDDPDDVIERFYNHRIIHARLLINEYWNRNGFNSWARDNYAIDNIYVNIIHLMKVCDDIEIDMAVRRDSNGEEAFIEYRELVKNTINILENEIE
jgi:hypothetical protein